MLETPSIPRYSSVRRGRYSDNVAGADNQQERLSVAWLPDRFGSFQAGFALGEASFMLVRRPRGDYTRRWKIPAVFNVSQMDRARLVLFRDTLGCGTMRKAGNRSWYGEVSSLAGIRHLTIPFFRRFPVVGTKVQDLELVTQTVSLLGQCSSTESDYYRQVVLLREQMKCGGKRRYTTERILRDYTPSSPADLAGEMR
jgi:hypothetical protein